MPFTLGRRAARHPLQPPHVGEHSDALLKEVGYSDDEIAALEAQHITLGD